MTELPIISTTKAILIAGENLRHIQIDLICFKEDSYKNAILKFKSLSIKPIGILGINGTVTNIIYSKQE